jgi:uncharacterized protein YggE
MQKNTSKEIHLLLITSFVLLLIVGASISNTFGIVTLGKGNYVTITGTSNSTQGNEIATFSAGVTTINSDKATAVDDMTGKATEIIDALKDFGIPDADIKTSNINVYQDQIFNQSTQRTEFGDWRANETVEITLRNVTRAADLATLLSEISDVTLYGPNFTINSQNTDEGSLLVSALSDAKAKAKAVAKASGKRLGVMTNFIEGVVDSNGIIQPLYARGMGGGGGVPVETGSSEITKTVTVTYRLY